MEDRLEGRGWSWVLAEALARGALLGGLAGWAFGLRFVPDPLGPLGTFEYAFSWHAFSAGLVAAPLALIEAWGRRSERSFAQSVGFLALAGFVAIHWILARAFCRRLPEQALSGEILAGLEAALHEAHSCSPLRWLAIGSAVCVLVSASGLLARLEPRAQVLAQLGLLLPGASLLLAGAPSEGVVVWTAWLCLAEGVLLCLAPSAWESGGPALRLVQRLDLDTGARRV